MRYSRHRWHRSSRWPDHRNRSVAASLYRQGFRYVPPNRDVTGVPHCGISDPTGMSPMNTTDMPAAGPAEKEMWARVSNGNDNNGRDRVGWARESWDRIDRAVHDEMCRVGIGRQFLPLVPAADATTVSADRITEIRESESASAVLSVDEAAVTAVIEIWVEFALTKQQTAAEEALQTAVTLGTRAANLLIQGEDLLLFQGDTLARQDPLFKDHRIQTRAGPGPRGLANPRTKPPAVDPPLQTIEVPFARADTYGENTFAAVAEAYSELQARGHYGPYALVLPTRAYADAFAPLENTLILTADRLLPLVEGRLYGTGTVPEDIAVELEDPLSSRTWASCYRWAATHWTWLLGRPQLRSSSRRTVRDCPGSESTNASR